MKLSIIIVTYNSAKEIEACLESLVRTVLAFPFEIIVVDSASQDNTAQLVRSFARSETKIKLVCSEVNIGFPAANNRAFELARGEFILMLNPDTIAYPGAIERLVACLESEKSVGICGPQLVDASNVPVPDLRQITFGRLILETVGLLRFKARMLPPTQQEALSGAAMAFRKDLLSSIGNLDEGMFYGEDIDFCHRVLRHGLRVRRVETATVMHLEGRSSASNLAMRLGRRYKSRIRYLHKHCHSAAYWFSMPLLFLEILQRLVKWQAKAKAGDNQEASIRTRAFRGLLRELPMLFLQEVRHPIVEGDHQNGLHNRVSPKVELETAKITSLEHPSERSESGTVKA